ncbi:MAG: class flavin-dependent oxidoreductase, partial [Verrucomicrobiaceae bacterium]|nr:class flavin-dependent oxidoreductase [Verrucomicrobiaceae bacterium]
TMNHRTAEPWKDIQEVVSLSDKHGLSGVLYFEGNDVAISPWLAGQFTFASSQTMSPIVAVNPAFMHPFTAAKMVSGFAVMYGRRTYLNMITGTALSYLEALAANLSHDDRYLRLQEYAEIIRALFEAQGQPVTYSGKYYQLENAKLEVPLPTDLHPEFFIAGQSEGALRTAKAIGACHMCMLAAGLAEALPEGTKGMHYGVLARPTQEEAWEAAQQLFPPDPRGQRVQAMSMANTDGEWKQNLYAAAKQPASTTGFWMEPFKNFKADRPYFVGSYEQAGELLAKLVRKGVRRIIIDFPGKEEGYEHTGKAFQAAQAMLG